MLETIGERTSTVRRAEDVREAVSLPPSRERFGGESDRRAAEALRRLFGSERVVGQQRFLFQSPAMTVEEIHHSANVGERGDVVVG